MPYDDVRKARAYARRWYERNREKLRKKAREYQRRRRAVDPAASRARESERRNAWSPQQLKSALAKKRTRNAEMTTIQREKKHARSKEYRAANPGRVREQDRRKGKKWRLANPSRVRRIQRLWASAPLNKEKARENTRRWAATNQARLREYRRNYYQLRRSSDLEGVRATARAGMRRSRNRITTAEWSRIASTAEAIAKKAKKGQRK